MSNACLALEDGLAKFGLADFRPGQRDVVDAVMSNADCLCIMPTGGGKSLCYQLPSVLRPGTTLVISPLIALMKDQVDALRKLDISATFVNSSLDPAEQADRILRIQDGHYDLVYVAPERFRSPRFLEVLKSIQIQLLAVDEAHCISEWGHDFRPDYMRLGQFRQILGNPQTIALTATATPEVRQDVIKQLGFDDCQTFVAGFARPNLWYQVESLSGKREKEVALVEFVRQQTEPGIVYASTRKACEELAEIVRHETGRDVGVYHAGFESDDRRRAQDEFMSGKTSVVIATNAFGMGIDKSDVRFVVHYNMTGTLEAYYQEAGRAGRDGLPSKCVFLYSSYDRRIQEFFIENAYPSREMVRQVYEFLRQRDDDPIELTQQTIKEILALPLNAEGIGTCERLLEKSGVIRRLDPNRNMAAVTIESDLASLVDLLPSKAKQKRKVLAALERQVGSRRHELVYFHPQDLGRKVGLTGVKLSRVLRELSELEALDYIPPFRGRAIHFTRRDIEFDDLQLDFKTLDERRKSDLRKLDEVARYARSPRCRQQYILRYFGEIGSENCGHCDNCHQAKSRGPDVDVEAPVSRKTDFIEDDSVTEAVRIVLSGVARGKKRFGKSMIAAMLCGSRAAKVTKWRLDELSTFGLLEELTQSEVADLIEALMEMRLIDQVEVDRFRPVVHLTELGREVMLGRSGLPEQLQVAAEVRGKLLARSIRAQPGLTNTPSKQDLTPKPIPPSQEPTETATTNVALRQSDGDLVNGDASSDDPISGGRASAKSASVGFIDTIDDDSTVRPDFYWTWRLLVDGYTVKQCTSIRRITEEEVLDHLIQAADQQWHVDTDWILSQHQVELLKEITKSNPRERLQQIVAGLPGRLSYKHVLFFLNCSQARGVSTSQN